MCSSGHKDVSVAPAHPTSKAAASLQPSISEEKNKNNAIVKLSPRSPILFIIESEGFRRLLLISPAQSPRALIRRRILQLTHRCLRPYQCMYIINSSVVMYKFTSVSVVGVFSVV